VPIFTGLGDRMVGAREGDAKEAERDGSVEKEGDDEGET
jgi:hypothetical protein